MLDNGKMENNMEKELTQKHQTLLRNILENGKMVKEMEKELIHLLGRKKVV